MKTIHYRPSGDGYVLLLTGHSPSEEEEIRENLAKTGVKLSAIKRIPRGPTEIQVDPKGGVDVLQAIRAQKATPTP